MDYFDFKQCIDFFSECTDEAIFIEKFEKIIQEYGINSFLIARLHFPHYNTPPEIELRTSQPQKWRAHYDLNDYQRNDLTIQHCFQKSTPILWSELDFSSNQQAKEIIQDARAFGLYNGLSIPFRADVSSYGMLSVSVDESQKNNSNFWRFEQIGLLQTIGGLFFDLLRTQSELSTQQVLLTTRERECLKWFSDGKSQQEVATILNISERTVGHYSTSISKKLNTSSCAGAVIKGLRHNLAKGLFWDLKEEAP